MHRRRYISLLGVGLSGGTAGCSQRRDESEPEPVRVVRFFISNGDDESHQGRIRLLRDGSVVYRDSWALEGVKTVDGTKITDSWGIEPPTFEPSVGNWSVRVNLENPDVEKRVDLNSQTHHRVEDCIAPGMRITDDGDLALFESIAIDACPPETSTETPTEKA